MSCLPTPPVAPLLPLSRWQELRSSLSLWRVQRLTVAVTPSTGIDFSTSITRQRGIVLVISLLFLVVLTLLGIATMRTNVIEERLAGNSRDWGLAFQAAEAALRDGEADIQSGTRFVGETGFAMHCSSTGLCNVETDGTHIWQDMVILANTGWMKGADATPSVKYGTYTGANPATISGVSKQPRYLIEVITEKGSSLKSKTPNKPSTYVYRITARGFGASEDDNGVPLAQVTLQTMYKP